MNVLITGGAGYIGALLIDQLLRLDLAGTIIGIDIKDRPALAADCPKLRWIRADVAEDAWISQVQDEAIDVVIHCAYQIRELYGAGRSQQQRWNIDGARKVSSSPWDAHRCAGWCSFPPLPRMEPSPPIHWIGRSPRGCRLPRTPTCTAFRRGR